MTINFFIVYLSGSFICQDKTGLLDNFQLTLVNVQLLDDEMYLLCIQYAKTSNCFFG